MTQQPAVLLRQLSRKGADKVTKYEILLDASIAQDDPLCVLCSSLIGASQAFPCCQRSVVCRSCADKLKACPVCGTKFERPACETGNSSPNINGNGDEIAGQSLVLVCKNKRNGCTWEGGRQQYDEHAVACPFDPLPCPNRCSTKLLMMRKEVPAHLKDECPLRVVECSRCGATGKHHVITNDHLDVCPRAAVECDCGKTYVREEQRLHRAVCPKLIVRCRYAEIGCHALMHRDEIGEHEQDDSVHLRFALDTIVSIKSLLNVPPIVFRMDNFYKHKNLPDSIWYSSGFYTQRRGYKMCISVNASGCGDNAKGQCFSLYVHLMAGEYDDNLIWPYQGTITIELLNQLADSEHFTHNVVFVGSKHDRHNSRVWKGLRSRCGLGEDRFLPYCVLGHNPTRRCQYLKDDCLFFRVAAVKEDESCCPWLTCAERP